MINKQDIVNHNHLLKKYGGLSIKHADEDDMVCTIDDKKLEWSSKRGNKGYHVQVLFPTYDPNDESDEDYEIWAINHVLLGSIWEYYDENPQHGIHISTKPESFDDDKKWIYNYCGIEKAKKDKEKKRAEREKAAKEKAAKEKATTAKKQSRSKGKSK